ncbi:MAG: hypothetical protein JST96_11875, partial [Bacteroidetes bacterium]|nr:hypothetical protein [Bacteroidota bacterium]
MRKFISRLILPCFTAIHCTAQTIHPAVKADYIQFGGYSKNFTNAFSFVSNQASLASQKNISAGAFSEQKFSLKELSLSTLVIAVPTSAGGFGLKADYFGYSDYNESQLGIAYAKKLGSTVDIGVQFNYYEMRMNGYGNYSTINFEIAALFHPSEKMNLGFHIYNPAGGKIGKNINEKLASVYEAGVGYEASDQVCVQAIISKEENHAINVNAGIEYIFNKQFFARLGVNTQSTSPNAGVGLSWKNIRL